MHFYYFEGKHRSCVTPDKLNDFNTKLVLTGDITKVSRRLYVLHRLNARLSRTFEFYRRFKLQVFGEYSSNVVGFDKELAGMKNATIVRGYFQTFEYIDSVREELIGDFDVRHPSNTFRNLSKVIKKNKPVVIHIRGGDYKSNKQTIGMLDQEYYSAALKQAYKFDANSEYWLFSNDKDYATQLISKLRIKPDQSIFPEDGLSDAETMKLMSLGSGIIICNSTFSWWAAYLNSNPRFVICPDKWFRGLDDPLALCPPNWIRVKSSWVS